MRVVEDFPHAVRHVENTWIPMPDGCRLAARIWLPANAEAVPVPAILEFLPYRKRDFMRARDESMHSYFAGHGYAAVRVDLRGSGDSEGVLHDEYTQQEHDDAVEIIRWIADQPWSTGSVGMMGVSWGGFNSLQVAALGPPELKAIITACSTDDRYADDVHYKGGCLLNENLQWGSILLTYNAYPPDPQIAGEAWREMWLERLENAVPFPALWMEHQHRDDYWKHGSVCEDFSAITCPVYAVGGWVDGYSNAIPRLLAGLEVPCKGLIGPWAHGFPHNSLPGPNIGFLQEAVRWWDHWLKGEDTGIMDEPALRVWMQEHQPPQPTVELREGRWVAEDKWPSPRIEERVYRLNPGILDAGDPVSTKLTFSSPQTTGLAAGEWCGFGDEGELPADQRGDDGRSLTFDSEPLEERLEIMGAPVVTLDLTVDRRQAFVAVRLNDVSETGVSSRVTYGLLNLCHRNGHGNPEPLEPGERYTVAVRLDDIAHAFPKGHRMRIAISTVYWPIAWPSPEPVTLGLVTGSSTLTLPVRPPRPEDAILRGFEPPQHGPLEEHTVLRPAPSTRSIERDLTTDETIYTVHSDGGDIGGAALARLDAIDLEIGYTIKRVYRIGEGDPLSARAEMTQKALLRRGGWSVRMETRTHLSATADHFALQAGVDAYEGDEEVFSRTWDLKIPRDLV